MAAIYERYESTLRAVILRVLHEEGETDDVLDDVFIDSGTVRIDLLLKKDRTDF